MKENVARLLHEHLRPLLDSGSMKLGNKLFEKIDVAKRKYKVGFALFSPQYTNGFLILFHPTTGHMRQLQLLLERSCIEESFNLLERMKNEGVKLDAIVFNILISRPRKQGRIEKEIGLFDGMMLKGCDPNLGLSLVQSVVATVEGNLAVLLN
ncbi:pentatricopeptide repeat-containing protein [Forsythia ovata]|uniref:Pentatricopeptide repeat-containing protein n=1 Tax=Forsythia ovata TaxID=205694 RepID=A0ABD1UTT3_9LAMI